MLSQQREGALQAKLSKSKSSSNNVVAMIQESSNEVGDGEVPLECKQYQGQWHYVDQDAQWHGQQV